MSDIVETSVARPKLPSELGLAEKLARELQGKARTEILARVECNGLKLPIRSFIFERSNDPELPVLALFGGVHGLERIGSEVVLAHLRTFSAYLDWDRSASSLLDRARVMFVPVVNPAGILLGRRSNGNGVDIMRNAPLDSQENEGAWRIYRGHRISNRLPWYRGKAGAPMEVETQAIVDFVRREVFPSKAAICLDVHSGFGSVDRLWYPYAGKRDAFPNTPQMLRLKSLLDRTLVNHVYTVEAQAQQYTTHGDVWDYLYELYLKERGDRGVFLPLTLEMGSWNWLKKNFFRSLNIDALFHPIQQHRIRRVLRRHGALFEFLAKAASNSDAWL